jgi:uncharacterized delta-60 repeat protein
MKKILLSLTLFASFSGFSQTITKDNSIVGGNSSVNDILVQSDGKIVVAGAFTYMNGSSALRIDRYNADGTPSTFASGAGNNTTSGTNDYITCLKELSNGDILVGGNFTRFDTQVQSRIAKVDADGFPVTSFVPGYGLGFNDVVNSIDVQSDGKIIVGGLFTDYAGNTVNRIARLTANGSYDNTFTIGTGFNAKVNKIKVIADNKILVAGDFTTYNGTAVEGLVILNADGTLNPDFILAGSSIVTGGVQVKNFDIQSDGKILIVPAVGGGRVTRINTDGTVDFSFASLNFSSTISSICIQPDGKVLVGGQFTMIQSTTMNHLLRLNTNGTLDNTFTIGTGLTGKVVAIKLQADNKILIGGDFTEFDGEAMTYFGRLNNCTTNTTVSLIYNGGLNGQNSLSAVQTNASYQWVDCDNGNTDISGQTSMTYAPTVSGSYAVKITTEECQVTSDCKSFYFCPLSNAVTLSGNTISVTTIPAQQPVFEWYADCDTDNPIAGATLSSFTPTASGNYSVSIGSNWEECNVISECIYVGLAGLEENQQTSFSIYPNPANENVSISNIEVGSTVVLVDVTGKVVSKVVANSTAVNVETTNFTPGVYFVTVSGLNGTQKLVIE